MQRDTKNLLVGMAFSWVPYVAVAWGYKWYTDGDSRSFWYALIALIVLRAFFSIIETLGSVLLWRVYGRRTTMQEYLEILRSNKMPGRHYAEEDHADYLTRIQEQSDQPEGIRKVAREIEWALQALERVGFLTGRRVHSAAEDAFNLYSPKSQAPTYDTSVAAKRDALFVE